MCTGKFTFPKNPFLYYQWVNFRVKIDDGDHFIHFSKVALHCNNFSKIFKCSDSLRFGQNPLLNDLICSCFNFLYFLLLPTCENPSLGSMWCVVIMDRYINFFLKNYKVSLALLFIECYVLLLR
jgi:hypothetical protein